MRHSSVAVGDSRVIRKSAVLTANLAPLMWQASLGRSLKQDVYAVSTSTRDLFSGSLVSLRAAMSILCLESSQAMSAV